MFPCKIFGMRKSEDSIVKSISVILPNIPRIGEQICIHNTGIEGTVTKVVNIYSFDQDYEKHKSFDTHTIIPEGSYYYYISVEIE